MRDIIRNASAWALVLAIGAAFWALVALAVRHWL